MAILSRQSGPISMGRNEEKSGKRMGKSLFFYKGKATIMVIVVQKEDLGKS